MAFHHSPRIRLLIVLAVATLVAAACSSDDATVDSAAEATATTEAEATTTTVATTSTEAEDSGDTNEPGGVDRDGRAFVVEQAQWADNVTITIGEDSFVFESDGLPAHEYLDAYLADGRDGKYIAGGVDSYNARFEIPLVPEMAASPSETGNGAIGVAISGAVFFDPYEGDGSGTVANNDNSEIDGIPFIDACGGHPLPNSISYHYHGIPFCITDAVDTDGQHSVLIGYLFDGIAIYGPQDVDGEAPTDLDECLGHVGPTPEFDEDVYHYHVTSEANYISECLVGVAASNGR